MTTTDTDRQRAIDREAAHHFQTYGRQPVVLERGEGSRVWDVDGREYLDALGGIAVNVLGHCHPAVTKAIQEQAARLIHVSNLYYTPIQSAFVEKLTQMAGFERAFLCNSGAEAVEGALKLVRRHAAENGRGPWIVGMEGCFHGRTMATLTLGAEKYKRGFGPLPGGFHRIAFGNVAALDATINDGTAGFVVEPIQGEGGLRSAGAEFLGRARELCTERGVLLVFDEIQCGNGRTGSMYAWQELGVRPDVLVTAKGLGGGVPIGAILADTAVSSVLKGGDHGTTFGGNPLACAAALATLEVLDAEDLPARAGRLGARVRERLEALRDRDANVVEIRGMGLMIGIVVADGVDGPGVMNRMREHGVLANCTAGSVIRLLPPLDIDEADLDRVLDVFERSLEEVVAGG